MDKRVVLDEQYLIFVGEHDQHGILGVVLP